MPAHSLHFSLLVTQPRRFNSADKCIRKSCMDAADVTGMQKLWQKREMCAFSLGDRSVGNDFAGPSLCFVSSRRHLSKHFVGMGSVCSLPNVPVMIIRQWCLRHKEKGQLTWKTTDSFRDAFDQLVNRQEMDPSIAASNDIFLISVSSNEVYLISTYNIDEPLKKKETISNCFDAPMLSSQTTLKLQCWRNFLELAP